jgi:hypothetical protein
MLIVAINSKFVYSIRCIGKKDIKENISYAHYPCQSIDYDRGNVDWYGIFQIDQPWTVAEMASESG